MGFTTRAGVVAVLGSLLATGCATKGNLRDALGQQRAELESQIEEERSERIAADERLAADLAELREDLDALRSEFSAEIEAVAEGLKFVLPVHFAYNEAEVRPGDYPVLERFTAIVNRHYTGSLVTVEGFTDPAGSMAYNRALAQRRAEAVRDHLVENGIEAQVRPIGYGEERLVVPDATGDDPGADLNRRVVFVIDSASRTSSVAGVPSGG